MKIKTILILAVLLILGWAICSRFDREILPEKGKEIQMIDEIVLGSIPATEESIPAGVFPVENRIVEQFSKDELVTVSYIEEPASDIAEAFIQTQFEGYDTCLPVSDGIAYDISEGESLNLEIVRCIWTPVDNLMYIGVYNLETETGYVYAYVDGNIQVSVTFNDLPAGEYVVYVKNMGDRMITDGTLRYRVS
ncbi:MAG: hypothetical protein IJN67_09250 [Oscillospiraceae bacterium]|nr:hypothetical protein [Oscillospiraceae bacterium]